MDELLRYTESERQRERERLEFKLSTHGHRPVNVTLRLDAVLEEIERRNGSTQEPIV